VRPRTPTLFVETTLSGKRLPIREIVTRAKAGAPPGLAPRALIIRAEPGAVFEVEDAAIAFPDEEIDGRTPHPFRRVVLLSTREQCSTTRPRALSVVPCTASAGGAVSPWDFEIPEDEPNFTAERVVALTHLVQPILKSKLVRHLGELRPETLVALQIRVAANFGFLRTTVTIPPRGEVAKAPAQSPVVDDAELTGE
jgi:hypothetical protein